MGGRNKGYKKLLLAYSQLALEDLIVVKYDCLLITFTKFTGARASSMKFFVVSNHNLILFVNLLSGTSSLFRLLFPS